MKIRANSSRRTFCNIFRKKDLTYEEFKKECAVEKNNHIDIFRDLKTWNRLKDNYQEILDGINKECFDNYISDTRMDREYLFYYLDMLEVLSGGDLKYRKFYEKFNSTILEILDFFDQVRISLKRENLYTFNFDGFSFTVNNRQYKKIFLVPTTHYPGIIQEEVLYIFLEMGFQTHPDCVNWPLKIDYEDTEERISHLQRRILELRNSDSLISLEFSTLANSPEDEYKRKLSREEKYLAMKGASLFSHFTDLEMQESAFDPVEKLGYALFSDNLSQVYLTYLSMKNGMLGREYIAYPEDDFILDKLYVQPEKLDPITSRYEKNLYTKLAPYILVYRDTDLKEYFKADLFATPDFYFPNGVYINDQLCFWIELKRNFHKAKHQVVKYTKLFGKGALLMEEGFLYPEMRDLINSDLRELVEEPLVLNGLHSFSFVDF